MPNGTELGFDATETIKEDAGILEGLEGLEAELYRDYKFQTIMLEGVLNTDEIIRRGFRIDRHFVDKVVNDELLFSHLPQAVKKKNKLRSHKDLGKIFPDTEEGRAGKKREREALFDDFVKQHSLSPKSSQDDLSMFQDAFKMTKKAWKKRGGFSRDDFVRFARNRATDPDLIKSYQGWSEVVFSSLAMLCWEAIRLWKDPEVYEIKEVEVKKEEKESQTPGKAEEKKKGITFSPQMKLAAVGTVSVLFLAGIFYFMIEALLTSDQNPVKGLGESPFSKQKEFSHLSDKSWARNPQNSLALLLKKKEALTKKNEMEKTDKKIYYPVIKGVFEDYLDFTKRVQKDTRTLRECGYEVIEIKGPEAELLAGEKKYQQTIDRCAAQTRTGKTGRSPVAAGGI